MKRFACERMLRTVNPREQQLVTVDDRSASRSESTGLVKAMETLLQLGCRIDRRVGWRHDLVFWIWRREMSVSANVLVAKNIVPQWKTVLHAKPVAPVIPIPTKLRGTAECIDRAVVGLYSKVATADVMRFPRRNGRDLVVGTVAAMMAAAGAMDPVVQAPAQTIDTQLLIAFQKSFVQSLLVVGFAVAIGVLQVNDLWRGGHQNTIAPNQDARGKRQAIGKQHRCLIKPIAILVGQFANTATGFSLAIET